MQLEIVFDNNYWKVKFALSSSNCSRREDSLLEKFTHSPFNESLRSRYSSEKHFNLRNICYYYCCITPQVPQVKYDIYSCLTTLHTKRAPDDEPVYPYLRTLLSFDTQGLLNVVSIAFEEPEFNTELGRCQKQRLVDILLKVILLLSYLLHFRLFNVFAGRTE